MRGTRLLAACIAAAAAMFAVTAAEAELPDPLPSTEREASTVDVQVLAINDFHGNLEATPGLRHDGAPTGGAEYLASHIRQLEDGVRNSTVVSAGDLIGASPLLSALFHDEPTIEAMNLIGLDYNAVGNHEFDEGASELLRMQEGGCHPTDGCLDGDPFHGAEFDFLAANVVYDNGESILPPYAIENYQGAKVAYIGMTLEGTPSIVSPSGIQGLTFLDEAETVNALVDELENKVDAIVVLLHEGGYQSLGGGINDCNGISGPIVDIVERMSDEVDLVVSGHTHTAYDCVIDDTVVTSAGSYGRILADIDLTIDRASGEVTSIATENLVVTRDVDRAGDVTALIQRYNELAGPIANEVIGQTTTFISRAPNASGESALGDVIADAQLTATADPALGGAQIAFMNPGGIRADLDAGDVTYGEAFTVQPFGNNLVTMTMTGGQIERLLEQQFCNPTATSSRVLQVSDGFAYEWSASAPCGSKIDPASIMLNGASVDPDAFYRVTVNSFLADGGDKFSVLTEGTDRLGGVVDVDALEAYFRANSPVAPGPQDRITRIA